jgi:quinolinate synthase
MSIAEIVDKYGYVRDDIEPSLNLLEEIRRLRVVNKAIILAYHYQDEHVQEITDYVGDSLGLARQAKRTDADIILFAGVHFTAETTKIFYPEKKVHIPDLNAGCSLQESCSPEQLQNLECQENLL